jgi:hypothetical protein
MAMREQRLMRRMGIVPADFIVFGCLAVKLRRLLMMKCGRGMMLHS